MFIFDLISEHVHEFYASRFEDRQIINVLTLGDLKLRDHQLLQVRAKHVIIYQQLCRSVLISVT